MYDNINLWFAKDINNNIITIDEVNLNNRDKYYCPMCGSDLIPKAIESKLVTAHFAHIDASKCNGESMIHFWFKNKFLEPGDMFTVVSDKVRQYICKEVLVEQSYIVGDKIYKPDVTVLTKCGNTIYFEMDYSNKKKVQDYIDIWLELKNIVVEVDIKKLMSRDKTPAFKALFYNGKCFNVKKNDMYYNIIGKYKEEVMSGVGKVDNDLKERIRKLDWFWNDVFKYKKNEVDIEYMVDLIDSVDNKDDKNIIFNILKKPKCIELNKNYIEFKTDYIFNNIIPIAKEYYNDEWDKYLKKEIQYDYFDTYVGYISCRDKSDNCFCLLNINEGVDFIKNYLIKIFNKNKLILQQRKIEQMKNERKEYNINLILNNYHFINIIDNLDVEYKLDVFYRWDTLEINLIYLSSGVVATRLYENDMKNTILNEIIDINKIIKDVNSSLNKYFDNIEKFKYEIELISIVDSLKNRYCKILKDIYIKGNMWLSNIYEINIFSRDKLYFNINFYITNNGILKDARNTEILYKYSDSNDLEKYLINKISDKIRSEKYK